MTAPSLRRTITPPLTALTRARNVARVPAAIQSPCSAEPPSALVAPLAVCVQPFKPLERRRPFVPLKRWFRGVGMRHQPEAAEPCDVFNDIGRFPTEWIRRRWKSDGQIVARGRTDLHPVYAQY